jgi:glucose-6-phosphate 1-dehydrogenase
MVIFGASGDLTKRKLLPALYSLARDRLLPNAFSVVGFARRPLPEWAEQMREGCDKFARRRPVDPELWASFSQGVSYVAGEFDKLEDYQKLKAHLDAIDRSRGTKGNRVFYLSTPPSNYPIIVKKLGEAGLINRDKDGPFTRVIIEKPFGTDLATATALNQTVQSVLREDQTYRIDHYLGKETVQNLFVLRFGNTIFEPLWNSKYIDHVQLAVTESIGIEGRGGYFEEAGMTRDMVQNHMFQFFSLMAMEPPIAFEADAVRDEKAKVIKALRPMSTEDIARDVVRGQYIEGTVMGEKKGGYKTEKGVKPDSVTESYVAMKVFIDNWRWSGVPFYIRAGKALTKKVTEIAIQFKDAPGLYSGEQQSLAGRGGTGMTGIQQPNSLIIRIQPDEGILLNITSKVPGQGLEVTPVSMDFRYGSSFGAEPPEAYERLILDCMLGESTLFTRSDEVEASWRFIDRIFDAWRSGKTPPPAPYAFGTWGPKESDDLLARDGRAWRRP